MSFVIPSIFTAIDKYSMPVQKMTGVTDSLSVAIARSQRSFNSLMPNLSGTAKHMLAWAETAAIAGAAIGAIVFSGKALSDYQTEIAHLSAVTGATGKDLKVFKASIQDVAKATKTSSVEVAKAFTAIANNQPDLLKDAAALGSVTKSAIILAQAANMELGPAGEAVTQILNQFGKGAKDAAGLVDILAAGSVAGSSEINDTAAAIQAMGTVAANAGVKINESVALIELVSKFEKGTEAGTKLRNILLEMGKGVAQDPKALASLQRLGVNINLVANNATPLGIRLKEISKIAKDNVAIMQVFGKENAGVATGLLNNIGDYEKYIDAVNTTGMAAKMAATNNDTLAVALDQLKARWVNMLTGSDGVNSSLNGVRNTVQFLTTHLDVIVMLATPIIGFFVAWKTVTFSMMVAQKALTAAIIAYNFVMGIAAALTGAQPALLLKSEAAFYGYTAATYAAAGATSFFGSSLVVALGLITAIGAGLFLIWKYRKEIQNAANDSSAGMAYNNAIGDYGAVKESLERKYINDPSGTRKLVAENPKYNSPTIQKQFDKIDKGEALNDDNDAYIENRRATAAINPAVQQAQQKAAADGHPLSNAETIALLKQIAENTIRDNSHGGNVTAGAVMTNVSSTTNSWGK